MRSNELLSEEKFWLIVDDILSINGKVPLLTITEKYNLTKPQFNCFYTFFKDIGVSIKKSKLAEIEFLEVAKTDDININMSLGQWLKFQAHFPAIEALKGEPFHDDLTFALGDVERERPEHDLFYSLSNFEKILNSSSHLSLVEDELNYVSLVEQVIVEEGSCLLNIGDKSQSVIPLRLVSVSNQLHLVYEDIDSNVLNIVDMNEVCDCVALHVKQSSVYTKSELDSFIKNIRLLESKEERLVMKIKEFEYFHKEAKREFFRNEVIVQNYKGEHIWAASIEPNDNIYEWIFSLGKSIEIVSSDFIKKEYLKFCQRKLKKLA